MKTDRKWQCITIIIAVSSFGFGWLFSRRQQQSIDRYAGHCSGQSSPSSSASQNGQVARLQERIEALTEEYGRLQARYEQATMQAKAEERLALYYALQTILIQLPVVASDLEAGVAIDPNFLAGLLGSIPRRLQKLEIIQVGQVHEFTSFDPRLHSAPPAEAPTEPGQAIRIAIPGFRYQDHILARAQVELAGEA